MISHHNQKHKVLIFYLVIWTNQYLGFIFYINDSIIDANIIILIIKPPKCKYKRTRSTLSLNFHPVSLFMTWALIGLGNVLQLRAVIRISKSIKNAIKDGSSKAPSKFKVLPSGKLSGLVLNLASFLRRALSIDTSASMNWEKCKNPKLKKTNGSQFITSNKISQFKTLSSFQTETWDCALVLHAVMGISKYIMQRIHWNSENGALLTVLKWIHWVWIVFLGVKTRWKWMRSLSQWVARALRSRQNVFWWVWNRVSKKKNKKLRRGQRYHLCYLTKHQSRNSCKNWLWTQ